MKVLVLGTGGPAGANTAGALKAAGHHVIGYDADPLHQTFATDHAHRLLPELTVQAVNDAGADVVIAQPDSLVNWLSDWRADVHPRMLLPSVAALETCRHKHLALHEWHLAGLRAHDPVVFGKELPDWLHLAADRYGLPFWLRATQGAGGRGATRVDTLAQGFHWIRYWTERGVDWTWLAEEYLPGRDYSWTGIYCDGTLIASFARERLEYLYPHLAPSGITGTPTIAKVIHDGYVNTCAEDAVAAVDENPHGVYNVDLRADEQGEPRPTEINAGRFNTTIGAWSRLTGVNLVDLTARLAFYGAQWWLARPDLTIPDRRDCMPYGLTLARHVDLPARLVAP